MFQKKLTNISWGLACVGLLTISSCKIFRPYERPELKASIQDSLYRGEQMQDSINIADVTWDNIFKDPILKSLIEEGLANNLDLKNAVLQIAQAEAMFRQSKLALLPNLNFAPQVSHNKSSKAALNFPSNVNIRLKTTTVQLGFNSNWELDVWGKLASARRAQQANLWQTEATRRAVQTSLIANIAQYYYTLIALDQQLAITRSTILVREKTYKTMQSLKDAAIVNGAAVVQSEANLYAAQASIPDLEQTIRELENSLALLLGKVGQAIPRTTWQQAEVYIDRKIGVPVQLLTNRPDVQAAELNFRKAFENTNVAKAQFYPSFTITSANAGISALTTKNLLSESIFYNFIGGLTQPIFNRGVIRANHKVALAQKQQAWNTFEKTILTAGMEVSNALYAYDKSLEKLTIRKQQITALEKSVDFNMKLLEYSSATNYTDVLTSEQSLLAAKLNAVNDQLQQYKSIIELYRALGGGS